VGEVVHLFDNARRRSDSTRTLVITRAGARYKLSMRPALTNLERIAITSHETIASAKSHAQALIRMWPDTYVELIDETGEAEQPNRGVVHVWGGNGGSFMIGHESRSGNSWGYFEDYPSADAAVTGAYALRDRIYRECGGERCDVHIPAAVLDMLKDGGGNAT